jgi:Zn-dependent protease with chaperone function
MAQRRTPAAADDTPTDKTAAKKAAPKRKAAPKKATPQQAPTNSAPKAKSSATEKAIHYPQLSPKAYEHPADKAATSALKAIPGLDTAVRWLIEQGYERALFQQNLAASVLLGPDQLPEAWQDWTTAVTRLDIPGASAAPPSLYLTQDPWANAMAVGSQHPYVVITSRLLEITDRNERLAVFGHEAGHILSGHVTYHTALVILLRLSLPALGPGMLPLAAVRLALLEWYRAAELSCDRAGALAVDDPELMCRSLLVLGGGIPSSQLSMPAFLRQAQAYQDWEDGPDRVRRFLANINRTHATPVRRSAELMSWVAGGDYDRIRRGEYIRRGDEPGLRDNTAEAVAHYSDRFREIFSATGDTVVRAGSRFQTWLRGKGAPNPDADPSDEKS